jgi:hypothetical protein
VKSKNPKRAIHAQLVTVQQTMLFYKVKPTLNFTTEEKIATLVMYGKKFGYAANVKPNI